MKMNKAQLWVGLIALSIGSLSIALSAGSPAAPVDQSILPAIYQTTWDPGIPGGIPADNDPVRPATVWLPSGNPYSGYSVNPALTGTANASAFTSAFQDRKSVV